MSAKLTPLQVATWEINPISTELESRLYYATVSRALHSEATLAARELDLPEATAALAEMGSDFSGSWCTPVQTWLLNKGLSPPLLSADYLEAAIELLQTSRTKPAAPLRCLSDEDTVPWIGYGISVIEQELNANAGIDCRLAPGGSNLAWAEPEVHRAMQLIAMAWPEAAQQLKELIRTVVLLRGHGLRSSSLPFTFGAIYLCPKSEWTIVDFADLLVHEAAHHSLEIKSSLLRFLENPQEMAASPLRPDARPVDAVLHAVFVLLRVSYLMNALLHYPEAETRDAAERLFNRYYARLAEGLASLESVAVWTDWGDRLFNNMLNGYEQLG